MSDQVTEGLEKVQAASKGATLETWRADEKADRELRNEQARAAIAANHGLARWHESELTMNERRMKNMDVVDATNVVLRDNYLRTIVAMERIADALEKIAGK